ncbi:MAG: hypothetical protein KatS3mg109_0368 [Pirellulaceae bacterium]|nr:MAG: hypothetical protein KatS3mg109_0368 [Pirellulaceae bacterium]
MALDAGRITVGLVADLQNLAAGLQQTETRMQAFGRRLSSLGAQLSATLGLSFAATGTAALRLSSSFDESMRKIAALTETSRSEVDAWRNDVRKLAAEFGVSATEAADALFFITSAGITGGAAMETLRASLIGTTIGLGETKTIADAATSAMNAYAKQGLTATRATEILTAGIKFGKFEAANLAPVLGTVTGTASALGVSFEDVVATLAVFSRTGTDAAEGVTQLQAIMSTLLGTSEEGKKILREAGLSLDFLREVAARPGGLIEVMRILDRAFAGQVDKLRIVIPNVRAFRGVMNALAQDAATVDSVFRGVRDSAGILDQALREIEGPALRLRRAWASLKDAMLELGASIGTVFIPAFKALTDVARFAAEIFGSLPAPVKAAAVSLGLLLMVAGPMLLALGKLIEVMGGMRVGSLLLARSLGLLGALFSPTGLLVAGIGFLALRMSEARGVMRQMADEAQRTTERMRTALEALSPEGAERSLARMERIVGSLRKTLQEYETQARLSAVQQVAIADATGVALPALAAERTEVRLTAEQWKERIENLRQTIAHYEGLADVLRRVVAAGKEAGKASAPPVSSVAPDLSEIRRSFAAGLREIQGLTDLLGSRFDALAESVNLYRATLQAAANAGASATDVLGPHGETVADVARQYLGMVRALELVTEAQKQWERIQERAQQVTMESRTPLEQLQADLEELRHLWEVGLITGATFTAQLDRMAQGLAELGARGEISQDVLRQAAAALQETLHGLVVAGQITADQMDQITGKLSQVSAQTVNISDEIKTALIRAFIDLGMAIGEAFAGVAAGIDSVGRQIKRVLGELLTALGRSLVAAGFAGIKIRAFAANPAAAIAAGVALIALGRALAASAQQTVAAAGAAMARGSTGFEPPPPPPVQQTGQAMQSTIVLEFQDPSHPGVVQRMVAAINRLHARDATVSVPLAVVGVR